MGAIASAEAWVRHLHQRHDFLEDEPMFQHLQRVALTVQETSDDEITTLVALLHHLSDTHITEGTITAKYGVRTARAVTHVSREPGEPDGPYAWRVGQSGDNHAITTLKACLADQSAHEKSALTRATRWDFSLQMLDQSIAARPLEPVKTP